MSNRWLILIAAIIVTGGVVGGAYLRSNSEAKPTATHANSEPAAARNHFTSLPADIQIASDGYVTLPDGAKLEISDGYITGVISEDEATTDYGNVLGTRYVVGSLDLTDVTRELWRHLDIEMKKPDGSKANIAVARPFWWMEAMGATEDATIQLAMQEVGIQGTARVLAIRPCDADSREGDPKSALVIGKIEHENAIVLDLVFDGDSDNPLGVTANHPLYSFDRHDWIPAGELKHEEKVGTIDGTATLTSKSQRPGLHKVYNMEVHRTHAYYVSEKGILAHNTGISCFSPKERAVADYLEGFGRKVTKNPLEGAAGAGRQGDAFVDGVLHEFKTLDPGAASSTIKNVVNNSIRKGGQARNIVIDARGTGLVKDEALRGIKRALGISRGKIDNITVIGDDFFVGLGP